jgi:DNA-binding XRE family transcriptional regulator
MDKKEFQEGRIYLGKTQNQLGRLLCVSQKAVQSFEQGWRNIPIYIERQMMLLVSLKKMNTNNAIKPCWEIINCPDDWRKNCVVWKFKARHFCWFINGTFCHGQYQEQWKKKVELCRECEVYQSRLEPSK